jgi:hypothetical protein
MVLVGNQTPAYHVRRKTTLIRPKKRHASTVLNKQSAAWITVLYVSRLVSAHNHVHKMVFHACVALPYVAHPLLSVLTPMTCQSNLGTAKLPWPIGIAVANIIQS